MKLNRIIPILIAILLILPFLVSADVRFDVVDITGASVSGQTNKPIIDKFDVSLDGNKIKVDYSVKNTVDLLIKQVSVTD